MSQKSNAIPKSGNLAWDATRNAFVIIPDDEGGDGLDSIEFEVLVPPEHILEEHKAIEARRAQPVFLTGPLEVNWDAEFNVFRFKFFTKAGRGEEQKLIDGYATPKAVVPFMEQMTKAMTEFNKGE